MDNPFHAQIDLDLLAAKLEEMGFTREGDGEFAKPARPARRAASEPADDFPPEPEDEDPWATDEPDQERRSTSRSAPRKAASGRSSGRSGGRASGGRSGGSRGGSSGGNADWPEHGTHLDRFDNNWTFGEPEAPECKHGQTALKEGVSQAGNEYSAWVCPVGFTKDYKKACKFFEYVED